MGRPCVLLLAYVDRVVVQIACGVCRRHNAFRVAPQRRFSKKLVFVFLTDWVPAVANSGRGLAKLVNGKDHLSIRVGDVLVPMRHSAAAGGWRFGALLREIKFPTVTPPELPPPPKG